MTFSMGSLRMDWRYWLAVSFMNWSINMVERVLARNSVDVFTTKIEKKTDSLLAYIFLEQEKNLAMVHHPHTQTHAHEYIHTHSHTHTHTHT